MHKFSIIFVILLITINAEPNCTKVELNSEQKQAIVSEINNYRTMVAQGLVFGQPPAANMQKIVWDHILQEQVDQYMAPCPVFGHNLEIKSDIGQNIFLDTFVGDTNETFTKNPFMPEVAIKSWFDEQSLNDFQPENVNEWHPLQGTGHYSQLVWAKTYRVGCSVNQITDQVQDGIYQLQHFLMCYFQTAGNIENEPMYIEGESCSQCPKANVCIHHLCGKSIIYKGLRLSLKSKKIRNNNNHYKGFQIIKKLKISLVK